MFLIYIKFNNGTYIRLLFVDLLIQEIIPFTSSLTMLPLRKISIKSIQRVFTCNSYQYKSLASFSYNDALQFNDQLTEEELSIYDTAKSFCKEKLLPRVIMANRHEVFDRKIISELGEMGFLGPTIHGYGCFGVGYVAYGLVANAVG